MITQAVEALLTDHVTLDVEGIDRIYLNAYPVASQSVHLQNIMLHAQSYVCAAIWGMGRRRDL